MGGGTARSFYVGLQSESADRPWLCVVPRDAQEGDEVAIDHRDFDLLMGQPVAFPLASSSVPPDDRPGDFVAAGHRLCPARRPPRRLPPLPPRLNPRAPPAPIRAAGRAEGEGRARVGPPR